MAFTMANASMAGQVFGAVSSAIGSYYSGQAQKSSLKFQADMAGINARIAELAAQSALSQGQKEVARHTLQVGALKGRQRVALAANGVDIGVGSAAEIQASTDIMKEIDANQIRANAVRNAFGYRTQGVNYQNEALIKNATASSISPVTSATTSLLGSATSVADSWYRFNKAGAFDWQPSNASDSSWRNTPDQTLDVGMTF